METRPTHKNSDQEAFELTKSQYLIWAGQQLNLDKPIYNMAWLFELKASVDILRFRLAFQALLAQSDNMRTVFFKEGEQPVQKVVANFSYELEFIDWSNVSDGQRQLEEWIDTRSQKIFNLEHCLFDSALIKLSDERYFWYINQHHLIIDAWGNGIQYKALAAFYEDPDLQSEATKAMLPSFRSYAIREHQLKQTSTRKSAIDHWQEKLKELPNPVPFYGRQVDRTDTASKRVPLALGRERSAALRQLAQEAGFRSWTEDLSLYNIFSTLLFAYLYRVSGQQKLAIGTPAHNRSTKLQKETVGLFIEIFPLSVNMEEGDTFLNLFQRVRTEVNTYLKNAQGGSSSAELSRTYNVFLNYINTTFPDFAGIPTKSNWIYPNHKDPAHHLRLQVQDFDNEGSIQLYFDLNTTVFDRSLQEEVPQHFLRLLDSFLQDPTMPITAAALTSETGAIATKYELEEKASTIVELFERQVEQSPLSSAVRLQTDSLSYQTIDERSNQLAHFLLGKGLLKGDTVAIYLKRSPEFLIGVWAVLKAGGTFVPIPTNYPSGRVLTIVADAAAKLILSTTADASTIAFPADKVIALDVEQGVIGQEPIAKPSVDIKPEDLAYLMYTSGSTGLPKGVMIAHQALSNYIRWAQSAYLKEDLPVMPLFTSVGFDLTITTLFLPLISGGSIVCYPESDATPDLSLLQVMDDNQVNLIKLTPSHLALLKNDNYSTSHIQTMIVGGEYFSAPLAKSLIQQFKSGLAIYNEYGPTEATVGCVVHLYREADQNQEGVPIGWPIANTTVYVLDEFMHAVPNGVLGELYVGGRGLANGYWKQEELSKEKFVVNPFASDDLLYRTGDLVRVSHSGYLEYLGRKDQQVKIGGRRIELEEISNTLSKHPQVRSAVVNLYKRDKKLPVGISSNQVQKENQTAHLIAYYTAEEVLDQQDLWNHLMGFLPDYMLPIQYIHLAELPLTINGKIDLDALPVPDSIRPVLQIDYVAPRTDMEQMIAEIWLDILGLNKIGVFDHFIKIGGDSLSGIRVMAKMNEVFELDLPINLIFEKTNVARMASCIEDIMVSLLAEMD